MSCCISSAGGICCGMTNAFRIVLDSASVRRAAVEDVSETVIAAIYLLHERSVDEIVAKLRPGELEQVIKLVGRCPSCYPPGTLDALKGRRHTRTPEPVASISISGVASSRPAERIKPDPEDLYRAKEGRLARLRAHASRTAPKPERVVTPAKTGTGPGTRAETARRRLVVEDLMKGGLSVRMMSVAANIPPTSVHRAMRALARADAKKEVAVAEIVNELLARGLAPSRRRRP
jgi:hypothetical protein